MPTYLYSCAPCDSHWDVTKSISMLEEIEPCAKCLRAGDRLISRTNFTGASDWNNQGWNPALGCYTKSNKQARDIAKSKGMVEVGNEPVENIHKHFDKSREEKRAQRWRDADNLK